MNRRGAIDLLVNLILIIVGTVLVAGVIVKLTPVFTSAASRNACVLSVQTQVTTKLGFLPKSPIPKECDRYFVDFEEKDFEVYYYETDWYNRLIDWDGKKKIKSGKYDTNSLEKRVYSVLAEEWSLCWYQFLEGKSKVFNDDLFDWGEKDRLCFICDEISFKPSIGTLEGFEDYLKGNAGDNNTMILYDYLIESPRLHNVMYEPLLYQPPESALTLFLPFLPTDSVQGDKWRRRSRDILRNKGVDPDSIHPTDSPWMVFTKFSKLKDPFFIDTTQTNYIVFIREGKGWFSSEFIKEDPPDFLTNEESGDLSSVTLWSGILTEKQLFDNNQAYCDRIV